MLTIDRALVAVHNFDGLVPLARQLSSLSIELVALPTCAEVLTEAGVPNVTIAEVTHGDDILDDQVNPLDPHILGGIVAHLDTAEDRRALASHRIPIFNLVITNLASPHDQQSQGLWSASEALQHADVVAPTYIRAAALHHDHVAIIVDPTDYDELLAHLREHERSVTPAWRRDLAVKAMRTLRDHDLEVLGLLNPSESPGTGTLPETVTLDLDWKMPLDHGQNPHQAAGLYMAGGNHQSEALPWRQLQGNPLSYGQILDLDVAWRLATSFQDAAITVAHHSDPVLVASDPDLMAAIEQAYGLEHSRIAEATVVVNRPLDDVITNSILKKGQVATVCAPAFSEAARGLLAASRVQNLVEIDTEMPAPWHYDLRSAGGGFIVQETDTEAFEGGAYAVAGNREPDTQQARNLRMGLQIIRLSRSYAAALVQNTAAVGIVTALPTARLAVETLMWRHGDAMDGAVLALDGAIIWPDMMKTFADNGIAAVMHLGGSVRADAVVRAADDARLVLVETGRRYLRY